MSEPVGYSGNCDCHTCKSLRDEGGRTCSGCEWWHKREDALHAELETERMRLVACGVVALANTPESAREARQMSPEYRSASLGDVERMVDSEMALRAEVARLREEHDTMCRKALRLDGELREAKEEIVWLRAEVGVAERDRDALREALGEVEK